MSGPGGDGHDPRQRPDGRRVGFVLATNPGIPDWKTFSGEDLRQLAMGAELGAVHHGNQLTRDRWRMLGRRLREAAATFQEEPELGSRCYGCGRPV